MQLVELGSILHMEKGKKPLVQQSTMDEGFLPYIDIKAFERGIVDNYATVEKSLLCEDGDLLIVCDGSRSGLTGRAIKGIVGSTLSKIYADGLDTEYLRYFIQSKYTLLNTKKKGTGTPHLNVEILKKSKLLIPPLEEQKRIVSHIEELFSSLDNAIDTMKKTKEQLVVYRYAVLKKAFEGKLSVEWRKKNANESATRDFSEIKIPNPIFKDTSGDENELKLSLPKSWLKLRMGEVFNVEVGATPSRRIPEYWNGDVNWVSSGEVHFDTINKTNECISQSGLDNSSTNVHPAGTVMLAMIGEGKTRGQAAILNVPAAHNQNTAAILVSETPCVPKYIYYFFEMNYENTRRVGSGNNQKALNKERVRALRFPFAPFSEQKEIVRQIDSRVSVCENIEKTVDTILAQAEAMRQSILKEAFKGRLA